MATETKSYWVVSWIWNGREYSESFDSRMLAEIKMIQLETFGMTPSLHLKG